MSITFLARSNVMDIVRVLRIVEYIGLRDKVENQINRSIQGQVCFNGVTIRTATVGNYPEILGHASPASSQDPTDPEDDYNAQGSDGSSEPVDPFDQKENNG